ncbi:hypothetical protein Tco_1409535 [Tanacetum coccineum]
MWHCLRSLKFKYEPLDLLKFVGDFSVIDGHLEVKGVAPPCEVKGQRPLRGQGAVPLMLFFPLISPTVTVGKTVVLKLLSNNEKSGSRPKPNSNNSLMAQETSLEGIEGRQNVTNMGVVRLLRDSIALENQTSLGRIHANSNTFSRLGLPSPQMTMTLPQVHSEEQESSTTVFPGVGMVAVNDVVLLRSHIPRILKKHFSGKA